MEVSMEQKLHLKHLMLNSLSEFKLFAKITCWLVGIVIDMALRRMAFSVWCFSICMVLYRLYDALRPVWIDMKHFGMVYREGRRCVESACGRRTATPNTIPNTMLNHMPNTAIPKEATAHQTAPHEPHMSKWPFEPSERSTGKHHLRGRNDLRI